ncbi:hypothetical protein DFH07DRAFT_987509 [Mycena maculata]|uniref:VWFA domain-containing protein n=1 Tax=Mycena maculata TaxID=230809 RepID=A0AAD7I4W1_9AGAR|nr:hypothetical protein DFH07DRAFT_987509 [Mycena maculata]
MYWPHRCGSNPLKGVAGARSALVSLRRWADGLISLPSFNCIASKVGNMANLLDLVLLSCWRLLARPPRELRCLSSNHCEDMRPGLLSPGHLWTRRNSFEAVCINNDLLQTSAPSSTTSHTMDKTSQASSSSQFNSAPLVAEPLEVQSKRSLLSAVFSLGQSRSVERDLPPPAYETVTAPKWSKSTKYSSSKWLKRPMRKETLENALETLRKYDTVILVDDSASMMFPGSKKGITRWFEAGEALKALAGTAQQYDTDGIDIYFLNNPREALNMKTSSEVQGLFDKVKPAGATPTGERLDQLLKPRIVELETARIDPDGTPRHKKTNEVIKRVNFIVITDGEATDDPKYAIVDAASRLKAMKNLCLTQIGVQFVQIGNDSAATRALKELDDDLAKAGNIRDIVDTTPYSKLNPVTADGLIKVLLGGINRRIDEQPR